MSSKQMVVRSTVGDVKLIVSIAVVCSAFAIIATIGVVARLYQTINELQLQVDNDISYFRVCFILYTDISIHQMFRSKLTVHGSK